MSYHVQITVNLPNDLEVDLTPMEDASDELRVWLGRALHPIEDRWTSLVITVVNPNPPRVAKTFVD